MEMNETPVVNFHLMHNFNPHPRMGMNGTLQKTAVDSFVFQPTPPHGDEPMPDSREPSSASFQPTPPHGDEQQKESIVLTND